MLFSITPCAGAHVFIDGSRDAALVVRLDGKEKKIGESSRPGFARVDKIFAIKFTAASQYKEVCDGTGPCRHHGRACPEFVAARRRAETARRVHAERLASALKNKMRLQQLRWELGRSQRVLFEKRRDELFEEYKDAPYAFREEAIWGTLAAIVGDAGVRVSQLWYLSAKERNKLQHALNGNIHAWFKSLSSFSRRDKNPAAPDRIAPRPVPPIPAASATALPAGDRFVAPKVEAHAFDNKSSHSSIAETFQSIVSRVSTVRHEGLTPEHHMPSVPLATLTDKQREYYQLYSRSAKEEVVPPRPFVRPGCCAPNPLREGNEYVIGHGAGYLVLLNDFKGTPLVCVWANVHKHCPTFPYDISFGAPFLATYPEHFHGHILDWRWNGIKGVACQLPAGMRILDYASWTFPSIKHNYRQASLGVTLKVRVAVCPKCDKLLPIHPDATQCEVCWYKENLPEDVTMPPRCVARWDRAPTATFGQKLILVARPVAKKRHHKRVLPSPPDVSPVLSIQDTLRSPHVSITDKMHSLLELVPDIADRATGQAFVSLADSTAKNVAEKFVGPTANKLLSAPVKHNKRLPYMSDEEIDALVALVSAAEALKRIPLARVQSDSLRTLLSACVDRVDDSTLFVDVIMALSPRQRKTAVKMANFPPGSRKALCEELFKLARSSADADIEVNPGPSIWSRRLAKFVGEHVVIPVGPGQHLRVKLEPSSDSPSWVPLGSAGPAYEKLPERWSPASPLRTEEFLKIVKKHSSKCKVPLCGKRTLSSNDPDGLFDDLGGWSRFFDVCFYLGQNFCGHQWGVKTVWDIGVDAYGEIPLTHALTWARALSGGRTRCVVPDHDEAAVMSYLRTLPRYGETPLSDMESELAHRLGYAQVQCPLCSPDDPYWCSNYERLVSPADEDDFEAIIPCLKVGFKIWRDVPDDMPCAVVDDLGEFQSDPVNLSFFRTIHITLDEDRRDTPGYFVCTPEEYQVAGLMARAAAVFTGRTHPVLYGNELRLQMVPPSVLSLPPGSYALMTPDGQSSVGTLAWPGYDYLWESGGLHLAVKGFGNVNMAGALMRSVIEGNTVFLDNVEAFNPWKVKAEMVAPPAARYTRNTFRVLSRPQTAIRTPGLGTAVGRLAYIALASSTVWTRSSFSTFVHMVSSSSFIGHEGQCVELSLDEAMLYKAPPRDSCACSGCLLAASFGPIAFCTAGSRGDLVPVLAIARQLAKLGLDTIVIDCLDGKGGEFLLAVQQGEVLSLGPKYAMAAIACRNLPFVTVGPPELGCTITWSLAPPPSAIRSFNFRLGPLLNPLLSWFAGVTQPVIRIASYDGGCHLPRSADGVTFLKRAPPSDRPRKHKYLAAMGSSGFPPPPGVPLVEPGDHYAQFLDAQEVVCHGGAGTVQTAAMAGCKVISIDNTLDRDYHDPANCQIGIGAEHHANKVLGLLLAIDFTPMLLANKIEGWSLWTALHFYVTGFLLADVMTLFALFRLVSASAVIVPGDWISTLVASLAHSILSGSAAGIIAVAINVWGTAIFARAGLTGPGIIMRILRFGRLTPYRPWLWLTFMVGGFYPTVIVAFIMMVVVPAIGVTRRAYDKPRSYLGFSGAAGLPFHAFLINKDKTRILEGSYLTSEPGAPYRLAAMPYRPEDQAWFMVPTLIEFDDIADYDQPSAQYGFLTHNCNTVLYNAVRTKGAFGAASLILYAFIGIASLIAIVGLGIALLVGLSSLILVSVSAITPSTFQATINEVVFKWRRAALIDRIRQDKTVLSSLLVFALVMTDSQSGLTPDEQVAYEAVTQFRLDLEARPKPMSLAETSALINQHLVLGPLFHGKWSALGVMFGMIPQDFGQDGRHAIVHPSPFVKRALVIRESFDKMVDSFALSKATPRQFDEWKQSADDEEYTEDLSFYSSAAFLYQQVEELYSDVSKGTYSTADEQATVTSIVEALLPNVPQLGELATVFEAYPIHGQGPLKDTWVADLGLDLFEDELPFYRWLFFVETDHPDHDGTALLGEAHTANLQPDDMDAIAVLMAYAKKAGGTSLEAITEAVLNSKDILHPRSRPVLLGSDKRLTAMVEGFVSATQPIRSSVQYLARGVYYARLWLHSDPVASAILKPFDAIFALIGFLAAMFINVALRLITFAIASLGGSKLLPVGTAKEVLTAIGVFLTAMDPRHRYKPKSAWALLWQRSRLLLTKGEALLFNLSNFSHEHSANYHDWAAKMIELLDSSGVDSSKLSLFPPTRAVFYPRRPVGIREYNDIVKVADVKFTEMANARRNMMQSLERGNPLAIDGAWLARPEDITASLLRYTVPRPSMSSHARTALTHAAEAIFEHHPELYRNPQPMDVKSVLLKSKWKYSAGLPFLPLIKKRETLRHSAWFNAIEVACNRIIESGKMPSVALHGFPKAQVNDMEKLLANPAKVRSVTAGDRITGTVFNTLLLERNKRVPPAHYGHINMLRRSEGGVKFLEEHLSTHPYVYSGDGRAFDSTAASEVSTVGSTELYRLGLAGGFTFNEKAATSLVRSYYEGLTTGIIVNLLNGDEIVKTGGGGTGSVATTPDNRDWVELVFLAAWGMVSNSDPKTFYDHFVLAHASDDVLFSVSEYGNSMMQQWVDCIRTEFGPDFTFALEKDVDNLIHLKRVSISDQDAKLYERLSMQVPEIGFRHDPNRLMFMRSAYRSDRARADKEVMAAHVAERSCGFQLLCAHSPTEYDIVTRDLADANLEYALLFFKGARANLHLDANGLAIDCTVEVTDFRPANHVKRLASRYGVGSNAAEWISKRQKAALRSLKQRRGSSYARVFETWVKPPPPTNESKAYRRWLSYRSAANAFNPLLDLLRLTANKIDFALSFVPSSLIKSTPEPIAPRFSRPFSTFDFIIEQYIYRREFIRTGETVSFERMGTLIRESPYAAATDISAFYSVLSYPGALDALHRSIKTNAHVYSPVYWPSNDALQMSVLVYMAWYTAIDIAINATKAVPLIGVFVLLAFSAYRWLDVIYSLQSLAFWLCTGSASLAISNSAPKDKYALQKVFAAILTAATPSAITWYVPGIFKAIGGLAGLIELQTFIPNLVQSVHATAVAELKAVPPEAFEHFHRVWDSTTPMIILDAPTGTGKSTSLPASILARFPRSQLVLLLPFNRLVSDYENVFSLGFSISRVLRETPRDVVFTERLVVMTPGQFNRRQHQFRSPSTIVILDEAHLWSTEAAAAADAAQKAGMPIIFCTGTPGHFLASPLFGELPILKAPRRVSFERKILPALPSFEQAVSEVVARGYLGSELLVYDPAISVLEAYVSQYEGLGVTCKLITSSKPDTRRPAAAFATGVIQVGANISPPPSVMIASVEHLVPVVNNSLHIRDTGVVQVPVHEITTAIVMSRAKMPAHEQHQLFSRVGREKDGLVIPLASKAPEQASSFMTISGILASGSYKDALSVYIGISELSSLPNLVGQLFLEDPHSPLGEHQKRVAHAFALLVLRLNTFSGLPGIYMLGQRTEDAQALVDDILAVTGFSSDVFSGHYINAAASFAANFDLLINGRRIRAGIPVIINAKLVILALV
ncbi:polyprotein [Sclerotium rolfsii hypovirus 7]|uniref:Polyprotein n=1 Tax=Sclerotium rolfsii hypovirus 7 TaxID=2490817 RepID=A0ABM7BU62_9VIRU|nr:polyprotein [Sclerotium rolfsii hypovirus 7]AZF86112.1 polyprotein [Sclerotium rolfsii hypovirus 7]